MDRGGGGLVSDAVRLALPQARVLPLVIECGTLDSAAMLRTVIAENAMHLHGQTGSAEGRMMTAAMHDAFVRLDPARQQTCQTTSLRHFDTALSALRGGHRAAAAPSATRPDAASDSAPVVEVIDLRKYFGALEVLKGIDLTARRGEVVAMIGSSGSGKARCCVVSTFWKSPTAAASSSTAMRCG